MSIPSATVTVQDPGLGVVGAASLTPIVVATSSAGTVNTLEFFGDATKVAAAVGYSDGVECLLQLLEIAGGPVGFIKVNGSIAAENGTVTQSGAGPLITLADDSIFDFFARVQIVVGGALGTATFKYSLDGYVGDTVSERTYSSVLTVPAGGSFTIPETGVTVTFPSGTYVADEEYTWTSSAEGFNAVDLGNAYDAAEAAVQSWRYLVVPTTAKCGDVTAHAALCTALQADLAASTSGGVYRAAGISGSVDDTEDPTADFGTLVADRELISFGTERIACRKRIAGRAFYRAPALVSEMTRAAGSLASTDIKRVPGNGVNDGGPLVGVQKLFTDERVDATGYGDIGLSTLRTYQGRSGFFITEGLIKSADGSDFTVWPRRLVMDIACETAYSATETFIGRGVRVNDNGTIDERDALRLEQEVQDQLEAAIIEPRNAEGTGGWASSVDYVIDRSVNIITTETIQGTVSIVPLGYIRDVDTTIGYTISVSTTPEA